MGYSHNVRIKEKHYPKALWAIPLVARDLHRLHRDRVLPPLAGPLGHGRPEFGDAEIAFNGVGSQAAETCYLGPTDPFPGESERFYFTKTGREPYDLAVMAAYALWWWHSGKSIEVGSDGQLADWEPALEMLEIEFGYVIPVRELFDVSYARLRFPRGLEVVLELRHESERIEQATLEWAKSTLEYLAKDSRSEAGERLDADVFAALRREHFDRAALLLHARRPIPGFGRRRFGSILFPDDLSQREAA